MNLLKELHEMKDTIGNEIAEANERIRQSGGDMNTADVEIIDKLTHTMKSLATTCAMLEAEESGYSGTGGMYSGRGDGMSREYRDSGNRGGYTRNEGRYIRNGYSRTGDMMEHLRAMLDEAPDEQTRMDVKRLMEKISQR
jgi:hypothetical protein